VYNSDGTLTIQAREKIKTAMKSKGTLKIFTDKHKLDYSWFNQYLNGYKVSDAKKAIFNKAIAKYLGMTVAELEAWSVK
jgi:transposase-like protein